MRNFVIAFLVVALLYNSPGILPALALDKVIDDPFTSNPMTTRWCERWHHIHYRGEPLRYMQAFDSEFPDNGECNQGVGIGGSCCAECVDDESDPEHYCSSTKPAFFVITSDDYEGIDPRTAQVDFALPVHLAAGTGDHLNVFSVTHPNCHGGVQAIVSHNGGGEYATAIFAGVDPVLGYCAAGGGGMVSKPETATLTTSAGVKYRLRLQTAYSAGPPAAIGANAKLIAIQNPDPPLLELTASFTAGNLSWYNTTTKRFGFGGGPSAPPSSHVIFDNFFGKAGC